MGLPLGRSDGRDDPAMPSDNAPYASRRPHPADRMTLLLSHALAGVWTLVGLRRAGGMLRHYARGTGRPYRADAAALLTQPSVAGAVDAELLRWRLEALQRWEEEGGGEALYPADTAWRGLLLDRRRSTDWWLALRGLQYRLTGTVRVHPDGALTIDHRFELHKSWNFDRGDSELGVPFTPFARLHETGLAREFVVTGEADGLVYDETHARERRARVSSS